MTFDTIEQLKQSGYFSRVKNLAVDGKNVSGVFPLEVLDELQDDPDFASGRLSGLHPEVGKHRADFRSYRGTFGEGSLQIVINKETGKFHADIDEFNPYADVVNLFGHAFGEVLPHFVKRVFKRKKQ